MKMKIIGYYSIFIGLSVMAMWALILLTEEPPEGMTELGFHLFSEFLMALLCLVSGILMVMKNTKGKSLNTLGLGMVIYSVLNAAGYYGERNDIPMMIMFIVICILTSTAVYLNLQNYKAVK